jgi:hypothetical protein
MPRRRRRLYVFLVMYIQGEVWEIESEKMWLGDQGENEKQKGHYRSIDSTAEYRTASLPRWIGGSVTGAAR